MIVAIIVIMKVVIISVIKTTPEYYVKSLFVMVIKGLLEPVNLLGLRTITYLLTNEYSREADLFKEILRRPDDGQDPVRYMHTIYIYIYIYMHIYMYV